MDRAPDGGVKWREWITPRLRYYGIKVFNPALKPTENGKEDFQERAVRQKWKEAGEYDKLYVAGKDVRNTDLRFVDVTSFLVCYIDTSTYACGTWEEFFLANKQKKPILVVCKQGKVNCPDWVFFCINHKFVFSGFDDMFDYLHHIDTAKNIDTMGRWVFFNN